MIEINVGKTGGIVLGLLGLAMVCTQVQGQIAWSYAPLLQILMNFWQLTHRLPGVAQ